MKKVLCFLLVLVLLGASLISFTGYSLIKESDNVTFTPVDEWGDRRYLEGITAEMDFSYHEEIFWDVEFTPFKETKTEYDYVTFYSLSREVNPFYGISTPSLGIVQLKNDNPELNRFVEELKAEATTTGEKAGTQVRFCDYFEYYPVTVNIALPGIHIGWQHGFGADERGKYSFEGISPLRGQGVINALNEFLRIPVKESDVREITVFPNEYGNFSYQSSQGNSFDFWFNFVRTENDIYFTFENEINAGHENKRELVDTSLIPGGYGIYSLPYTEDDIKYEELRTVYSIPSDATAESLSVDEERKEIYLGLHENEKFILHIIDMDTMTDKTAIELFDFTFGDFIRVSQNEDFFVFIKNDGDFNVVAINEDGIYESALTGTMPPETIADRDYFSYRSEFGFDGERLAVWVIEEPGSEEIRLLSLQPDVMVFTKDGLQYYCKWLCSLGDPIGGAIRWDSVSVIDWRITFQ